MGVHCRGCLRGFASRFNAPARPPSSSVPSNFAGDPEKGTRISLQFRIQFSPVFPRFRFIRYRDWINRLHALLRARKFYRKFRRNFIFSLFLLVLLVIREVFFRIPSNSKIFRIFYIFFYFFENLSAFREFFTFPWYFCRVRTEDRTTMRVNFFFEGLVARLAGWLIFQPITEGGWNAKTWKRTRRSNDQ